MDEVEQSQPPRSVRIERLRRSEGARLGALVRVGGPHVESVLDVGTAPNGDLVLELPWLPHALEDLLAGPGGPSPGEAVTVLAPLAAALGGLHAAGVAHGSIGVGAVRLDAAGTPVWCAMARPVLRDAAGELPFAAAVDADTRAFHDLAATVLSRFGEQGAACAARVRELDPATAAAAVFDLAEPQPVRLAPAARTAWEPVGTPSRLAPPLDVPSPEDAVGLRGSVTSIVADLRVAAAGIRPGLGAVRARVWVLAAVPVVALVAALVLLPGRDAGAEAGPGESSPRPTISPVPPQPVGSRPAPVRTRRPPDTEPDTEPVAPRSLEPVAAATALLDARAGCLAGSDERCLARVESARSPVAVADLLAVRSGTEPVHTSGAVPTMLSRGGGTALLDVDGTTVLIVREPGGWVLRGVVASPSG